MGTEMIITGIIGIISTCVSSWATWFFSKKRYTKIEINHSEIEDMKESLNFYKDLSESTQKTLSTILNKSEELASTNIKLLIEVQNLKVQVNTLLQVINIELKDIDLSKYGIEVKDGNITRKEVSKA